MPRLLSLALCLLLLVGCAAAPKLPSAAGPLPPEFPPAYSLQAQLEAFRGEERTSRTCFEAVQTAQGFYYADSTGQRYLFLLEGADAYALYLWDREGALTPSAAAPFTRQALEAEFNDAYFYLTEEGFVFYFQPDTLAPYAAGLLEFSVPYDSLQDLLTLEL